MELKNKIEKVLKDYGCLQKHKNEGVGEVYNQIRNEDLVNDLFALYSVVGEGEQLVCDKNELDCPYDFTSRCTMGRCDCKPKAN